MRVILGAMSGCSSDADCDDGNKCNGISTCQSGTCTQTTPPVTCPTPDQCHDAGTCDPTTGTCSNPAKPDSTACNDGNACTQTDTCQAGVCTGSNPVVCQASDQCHVAGTCNPNRKSGDTACTDDGNPCTLDQCDGPTVTCQHPAGNAGAICRTAAGACDVAETCTGASAACPADAFASSSVVCRAAAGECDVAETCPGNGPACPTDAKKVNGAACTDDGNPCTLEQCDGTTVTCQHPAGNAGAICRTAAGACDVAETCTGASAACPADGFKAATEVCRATAGECDVAETCPGNGPTCPADAKKASGTACTADDNPCTLDQCDGTNGTCQHPAGNAGAVCRATAGECDVAETCMGTNTTCPADAFKPSSIVCRPAAGVCDVAETCTGSSAACPADAKQPNTVVCRASAGACDVAETCPGTSNDCPADGFKANTAVCRAAADVCDVAEQCTGSSATCPVDGFASNTTACDDHNACTTNDHCDGNGHCTGGPAPDVVLHLIKHVVNHDSCTTSPCLNGLVASDFDLTVRVNSTSTIYAGIEAPGTAINLKIGDTFAVTEDLTTQSASQPVLNPGGVQGDISHFYTKRFSSNGCSGVATCNPTTGPQEQTCTVTNDDILLQNQLGIITITENPWTYMPAVCPGEHNNLPKVTTLNGSFDLVNVSLNQPYDALVTNMSVLLEYRDENTGQLTTLVDPATCTFQLGGSGPKVTSFTFTTMQVVSFSCNVSSLPVTTAIDCHDVVKATVRVHLFQRHTTFTTFTASYTR